MHATGTQTSPLHGDALVMAAFGPQVLADITPPLSDADRALLDDYIRKDAPAHVLAFLAFDADGTVRNQDALDRLLALDTEGEHR